VAQYFDAIQIKFPEFANLLSIGGTIKYGTLKSILSNPNPNPELIKFLNVAFNSPELNSYYLNKNIPEEGVESFANPELDRLLLLVQNGDWAIEKIEQGNSIDTLVFNSPADEITQPPIVPEQPQSPYQYLAVIGVGLAFIIIMVLLLRSRKELN
jgi:hypothetical protein